MATRVVCLMVKGGTSKIPCRQMWRTFPGAWCTACHKAAALNKANAEATTTEKKDEAA